MALGATALAGCGGGEDKPATTAPPKPQAQQPRATATTTTSTAPSTPGASGPTTVQRAQGLGQTLRLTTRDTALEVSVDRVSVPLTAGSSAVPDPGYRFAGVGVTLRNVGRSVYNGTLYGDADLFTRDGAETQHSVVISGPCAGGDFIKALAPGDRRRGCFVFELPVKAKPGEVRITPDGGFGPSAGSWPVPASTPDRATYPPESERAFVQSCSRRGSPAACRCLLTELQKRLTYEDFEALDQQAREGYTPRQARALLTQAARSCRDVIRRGSGGGNPA